MKWVNKTLDTIHGLFVWIGYNYFKDQNHEEQTVYTLFFKKELVNLFEAGCSYFFFLSFLRNNQSQISDYNKNTPFHYFHSYSFKQRT